MKIATLITAAALACGGTAFAAGPTADKSDHSKASTASTQTETKGEGIGVKTKRAFKRMGDKLRSIGNKDTREARTDNDTRAMGAGADAQDKARRERMDSAYSNWQSKPQK